MNPPPFYLRSDRFLEHVSIALVGKYTKLSDSYTSVIKALEHSALAINHKLEVKVWKHFTLLCVVYWFLDPGSLLCSWWSLLLENWTSASHVTVFVLSFCVLAVMRTDLPPNALVVVVVHRLCRPGDDDSARRTSEVSRGLAEALQLPVSRLTGESTGLPVGSEDMNILQLLIWSFTGDTVLLVLNDSRARSCPVLSRLSEMVCEVLCA